MGFVKLSLEKLPGMEISHSLCGYWIQYCITLLMKKQFLMSTLNFSSYKLWLLPLVLPLALLRRVFATFVSVR